MKKTLPVLIILLTSHVLVAAESVPVPWTEFKHLYKESVERELMASLPQPESKAPQVHAIEEAVYTLAISQGHVRGHVSVCGRIVSGDPEPVSLFGNDIVVAETTQVSGGSLLPGGDGGGTIAFLPDGAQAEFRIALSFLVRAQEDNASRFVSFAIPAALRNALRLELSPDINLLEDPGIADEDGVYHFSAAKSLCVRFRDKKSVSASPPVEIDTFSHVRLQGRRAIISTLFATTQPWPRSFVLQSQEHAHYVSSSLKSSWITSKEEGAYEINIPSEHRDAFTIQMAAEESTRAGHYEFLVPTIAGNNGRQGDFVVEEPDGGRISLAGRGLVKSLPIDRLGEAVALAAGNSRFYMHMPEQETITLDVQRFRSVATPDIVLDTQKFFISFEENGNVLSVLSMDIPPEKGPRMELKALPDTDIWALTVNGQQRKVYTNDEDSWIIPLESGKTSHVELALLKKGESLGLHGRLEAMLPATGMPSRTVEVGIALPTRIQLLSLEGPLRPSSGTSEGAPAEFMGRPHFFSRSFYKGQGMTFAVAYKEPVRQGQ